MTQPFRQLLRLQAIDSELDELRARLGAIERGEPLRRLEEQMRAVAGELERMIQKQRQAQRDAQRAEAEARALREERQRLERRLYGGEVGSMKEMQSMQARIEHLGEQADAHETAALEAMERAEQLKPRLEAAARRKGELEQGLAKRQAELNAEAAAVRQRLERLEAERQAARADIPASLLEPYDFHRRRGGVVLAAVRGDRCGACEVTLSVALLSKVKKQRGLETCENCGRLLVWAED
ncbi:MAG TPA: C4-type zinc ribbon domain-containing protein [Bacillota bacterium]